MTPLLIALLFVLILPLFVATWRASLLGLACQGLLTAWIAYDLSPSHADPSSWLTLADLVLVRSLGAPLLLYRILRAQNAPRRNDVIPPNLLSWTFALGLTLAAFDFAQRLETSHGDAETLLAVAIAGLLLGLLVLATQADPFSQIVGALRIENAIALFALEGRGEHSMLGVELGETAIVAATIAFYAWYLQSLRSGHHEPASEAGPEEPTF